MNKPTQVRRMSEWETDADEALQLPAVRNAKNFVAPLPVAPAATWQPAQPHELQQAHSVAQIVSVQTSHVDRARGFAIVTGSLSVVVGVFAVVAALTLFSKPLIAAVVLSWFFSGFVAVWLISAVIYYATSPDGIALLQVATGFRLIRKEQDFRHEYIRHVNGIPQPDERRHQRRLERNAQKGRR
jgi:hypothetical protein